MRPGQVVPDRRRPVENGPGPDRTAVPEQVAEQITGESALHVEQVPLLQHQQRDGEREPLDDPELNGLRVGGRGGHPQAPGQLAAHHDGGGPGGRVGPAPARRGPAVRFRHRHPGHHVAAAGHLLGLQRGARRARPPRGRGGRRAVAFGGRARQHAAVGVLHRDRSAQRRRERADQFTKPAFVQHELHQLVVLLLGPLKHGSSPAQLVVGPGQLPDDLLLLGPQPCRLQRHRGLTAEQFDEFQLGSAELACGDRVGDDDPGPLVRAAQRRGQQGLVALRRREVPQPAVRGGLPHVGDDDRAILPVRTGGRGVEVGTGRVDAQRAAVTDLGQVIGREAAAAGDVQALPPFVGQHHRAELEPDQLTGLHRYPREDLLERLGGVDGPNDLAHGGHPGPQRGRDFRHAHTSPSFPPAHELARAREYGHLTGQFPAGYAALVAAVG